MSRDFPVLVTSLGSGGWNRCDWAQQWAWVFQDTLAFSHHPIGRILRNLPADWPGMLLLDLPTTNWCTVSQGCVITNNYTFFFLSSVCVELIQQTHRCAKRKKNKKKKRNTPRDSPARLLGFSLRAFVFPWSLRKLAYHRLTDWSWKSAFHPLKNLLRAIRDCPIRNVTR